MLAYERAAGGERAACGGAVEWTPEGDRKGRDPEYGRRRENFVNK